VCGKCFGEQDSQSTVRKIMAKKTRGKAESKVSEEEATAGLGKDVYVPIPEQGGIINFYYLFGGIALVLAIIMIGDIVLHYLLHIF
jgi:hypothetical protein